MNGKSVSYFVAGEFFVWISDQAASSGGGREGKERESMSDQREYNLDKLLLTRFY